MPKLKKGDTICVVAPAGYVAPDALARTISFLNSEGYNVEFGQNLYSKYEYGYNYSGTVKERAEDFQWALNHPTAKIIWCARGGYGCVQLIDKLDFSYFKNHPKWVIGYSDNTVFHQYLSLHKIPSIHGVTLKPLNEEQVDSYYENTLEFAISKELKYSIEGHNFNHKGKVKAKITGGNLSIIDSLLSSKTIDDFKGKILFIEDWQENWYSLDRMLMALERAGIFAQIKGLIVGSFTKMDTVEDNPQREQDFDEFSYQIINDKLKKYKIPKCFGFPAGHITNNKPIIFSKKAKLHVSDNSVSLKF